MERWEYPRQHGRDSLTAASTNSYPRSFSSSLLDAIYRSIDDGGSTGGGRPREGNVVDTNAMGKQLSRATVEERKKSTASTQKPVRPSRGGPAAMSDEPQQHKQGHQPQQRQRDRSFTNSTSSSSESSYGGFSSSDAEKPAAALSATPRPRPIRTSAQPETRKEKKLLPKEGSMQKTEGSIGERFRASKLYRELKKAKPPVSPGARLASFINTLFGAAGSTRKAKSADPSTGGDSSATGDASLCSSASSYTRSRLSRTPSSIGNAASGRSGDARRSVRFFPVSFVVDEDCRPRGHRWAYADQKAECLRRGGPPPAPEVAETRKPTREATREFVMAYEEKKRGEEEEEDDGAASYSSSDLFELENLAAIGAAGELPVYETTRLEAHRAISQGLGVQKKPN